MGFTLRVIELLQIPTLQHARLVAGQRGIERVVDSVNMMDAPDISQYLRPHELLLTTAYAVKDHPGALDTLVEQMAKSQCAGLAIKTKRFLDEIPPSVIETANRMDFPLLELPLEYSLGEVLNQALGTILQQKTDELSYALETHHTFFHLILKGEGIAEIVATLAELIESPIVIVNSKFDLVSLSHQSRPPLDSLNGLIEHFISHKASVAEGFHAIPNHGHTKRFPYAYIQPIPTFQWQGYIIAFTGEEKLSKLHSLALEQASNVLGFELLKSQAVKDRARRFKTEFFSELVQGDIRSEQEIIHRGKQHGLFVADSIMCIVCGKDIENTQSSPPTFTAEYKVLERDHLYQVLKKEYTRLGVPFVLFTNKDEFVSLVSAKEFTGESNDGRTRLAQKLQEIADHVLKNEEVRLSFGIGAPTTRLIDIPITYKQAMDAYRLGKQNNKHMFVQFHRAKELIDLLRMIPLDDLQEFFYDTFHTWVGIEEKEQLEWRRTLKAFYDNQCHIADTAKQLYIHRNTVLYRLNRIEQLTGIQVRNPADSLRIRAALLLEELLE